MGVMRFQISPPGLLANMPEADHAYITGPDKRVFACRSEIEGDVLTVRRQLADSGKLHICWPVEGYGRPVSNTCSLPEREEPYLLPVELARGKMAKLRDQLGGWQIAGMVIPRNFFALQKDAQHLLARAVQRQDNPEEAGELAQKSLTLGYQAADLLTSAYTQQRLENLSPPLDGNFRHCWGAGWMNCPPSKNWKSRFSALLTQRSCRSNGGRSSRTRVNTIGIRSTNWSSGARSTSCSCTVVRCLI